MRAAGSAALLVALIAGDAGASPPMRLQYDVRYGPLRLVALRTTVLLDGERYRASSEMETVGIVASVFPWRSEAVSEGSRLQSSLVPQRHRSEGIYRGERRLVELDYGDGGMVQSRVEPPPEKDWREGVPLELQQTTIDPLTAGLAVMASDCRGRLPVFDGRRRYDLELTDLGQAEVESSSYHLYSGGARRCRAEVKALGGFWRDDPRHSEKPTTLDYWIAAPRGDLPPLPVYLELSGQRGTLSIHLTAVDGPPPPSAEGRSGAPPPA
jgi:hypothetical protein